MQRRARWAIILSALLVLVSRSSAIAAGIGADYIYSEPEQGNVEAPFQKMEVDIVGEKGVIVPDGCESTTSGSVTVGVHVPTPAL